VDELEHEYDASIPETATEELLACVHILYRMFDGSYPAVDKWLMSSNENLMGDVPINKIRDGEGLYVLEYLRDIQERGRYKVNGGMN